MTMVEIQALIPSFRAVVAAEITLARRCNGAETVKDFATAVNRHRVRYVAKLKSISALRGDFASAWMAAEAVKQINKIAADQIGRAEFYQKMELTL